MNDFVNPPMIIDQPKSAKPWGWIVTVILALILGFFSGTVYLASQNQSNTLGKVFGLNQSDNYLARNVDFKLFWEVWQEVKNRSVIENVPDTQLFYGAIKGLVASLNDPYSVFFDPKTGADFENSLSGTFDGIGCELGIKDNFPVVIAPLPGTPAEKAGLRPGDVILAVDKKDVTQLPLDQIITLIRGQAGTTVTLSVVKDSQLNTQIRQDVSIKELKIKREKIVVETVRTKNIDPNIGYIQITSFNSDTAFDFRDTLRQVLATKPKALILDLRNNPGGYVLAASNVAGYWVGDKVVVTERGKDAPIPVSDPNGSGILATIPTVVLVNGGSASASEIVAGALKDYDLATVLGEKTYGKGTVQDLISLNDGSLLKLTIAKWYTPKDVNIDKEGIVPNIEVKFVEPKNRKPGDIAPLESKDDNQLQAAIKLIKDNLSKKNQLNLN